MASASLGGNHSRSRWRSPARTNRAPHTVFGPFHRCTNARATAVQVGASKPWLAHLPLLVRLNSKSTSRTGAFRFSLERIVSRTISSKSGRRLWDLHAAYQKPAATPPMMTPTVAMTAT